MKQTKVVNVRNEECDIWIGRYKKGDLNYGNPFFIGKDGSRKEVVEKHMRWLEGTDFVGFKEERRKWIITNLPLLYGERIGCVCAPKLCHGDNYVRILKEGVEKWKKRFNIKI